MPVRVTYARKIILIKIFPSHQFPKEMVLHGYNNISYNAFFDFADDLVFGYSRNHDLVKVYNTQ